MQILSITEKFDLIMSYFKDNKSTFAKNIGITRQSLNNYYSVGSEPSFAVIIKVIKAYNIDARWLLSERVDGTRGMLLEASKTPQPVGDLSQKIEVLTDKVTKLETLLVKVLQLLENQ